MADRTDAHAGAGKVGVALVVRDDERRRRVVAALTSPLNEVFRFESLEDVHGAMATVGIDVIVTDLFGSPGPTSDGQPAEPASRIPPVVVVAPTGLAGVDSLEAGAADYVVEPFNERELRARTLLRARESEASSLVYGDLVLERAACRVSLAGVVVDLTRREYDLLVFLAERPGRVVSREQLLDQVWGPSSAWQSGGTVTEHVHRVRRKIAGDTGHGRYGRRGGRVCRRPGRLLGDARALVRDRGAVGTA